MTRRTTTTAAVAAAGATLAFGAYAIGSQAGDGDATAASSARTGHGPTHIERAPHPRHGVDDLAGALGVPASKLEAALEELRVEHAESREHDIDIASALADALGTSADEVEQALGALRDARPADRRRGHRRHPDAALAKALGVTPKQLRAAFEQLHDRARERHEQQRAEFAKQLAAKLGLSAEKVEAALAEAEGPFGGPRGGPGRGHGPGVGVPEVRPFGGRS